MFDATQNIVEQMELTDTKFRTSTQPLLPQHFSLKEEGYQIYPFHSLDGQKIFSGYSSLASWIVKQGEVTIDGYGGVLWKTVKQSLQEEFDKEGLNVQWIDISECLKSVTEIQAMVEPFLGTPNSVWGKRCNYKLEDFFDLKAVEKAKADKSFDLSIVYGTGAALANWKAPLVYLEVPKNEIQYRIRAKSITNIGCEEAFSASEMYKRFYFVDWVVLNEHKKNILDKINVIADVQWKESLNWMFADSLKEGLAGIGQNAFRVRPWFEPGAWGGQWMKDRLKGINKEEVNYAWSFEMIVPENGLVFESDGNLLEVPFDFLMFTHGASVLGKHHVVFGDEFPIRFDFLDTWEGGNLSIQCHPSIPYIRKEFGENITQDETYYIMDCKEDANVYLGFQDNINPEKFRKELENSKENNQAIQIEDYVQVHKAQKHDLFLIPNGTIHSAGANNLVLEISATPYIFTFKMYDWLRLDLNGEPRAINIEHAFNNLRFEYKGEVIKEQFISKPSVIEEGKDWKLVHLPTHKEHFYDVHRLEFDSEVTVETNNTCHVLMLVEGSSVLVKTAKGVTARYHYAETFAIPAAAERYTIINEGNTKAKIVKAFVKEDFNKI